MPTSTSWPRTFRISRCSNQNRPEGTQDDDPDRRDNARLFHAAMRRKLFFEGDEAKMRAAGLPGWKELYRIGSSTGSWKWLRRRRCGEARSEMN